jgi:ribosome maturation factor RimP
VNHEETVNKIHALVEKEGVLLVDVHIGNSRYGTTVKIFADTLDGITIEQLSKVHTAVHTALNELFEDITSVSIQVSSPGLDAPLRYPWQYLRHKDHTVSITFRQDDTVKSVTGLITDASSDEVLLTQKEQTIRIPFRSIDCATVQATL